MPVITRVDPVRRSRNHGIMQTLLSCKIAVSATISLCRIDILTLIRIVESLLTKPSKEAGPTKYLCVMDTFKPHGLRVP